MPQAVDYIALLIKGIEDRQLHWDWRQDPQVRELEKWRAFRWNDRAFLKTIRPWKADRPYKADPLPGRAAIAFSDFLFAEDPLISPANEEDRVAQFNVLQANNLTGKCRQAADTQMAEREVWWKIYLNDGVSEYPCLDFFSRTQVVPYMYGEKVLAVAFISSFYPSNPYEPVYRLLECHAEGLVRNYLYKGAPVQNFAADRNKEEFIDLSLQIGDQVPLTEHVMTATLMDQWDHGLPILAGRLKNGIYPTSIYEGVEDFLLDLNETHVIDAENYRLAGKKRARMPKSYADQAGDIDAGEEIFYDEGDADEVGETKTPFEVLQYEYNADASIKRKDDLERIILTRMGLARQLVDANASEGLAQTGTALKTRLLPTVAAIKGASKEWQDNLPTILCRLQQVDALGPAQQGPGHSWNNAEQIPSVRLADPLPIDLNEEAARHQVLVVSELESIEEAVHELHPGWSADKKTLEVKRILANRVGYALDDAGKPVTPDGQDAIPEVPRPPGRNPSVFAQRQVQSAADAAAAANAPTATPKPGA